jgi:sporulation protein YtfJ
MSENKMSEMIRSSLESIKDFANVSSIFGTPIITEGGVTVIPVSRISVGFAGGGVDLHGKRALPTQNFGGGSGTGISVTPVAFLTVDKGSNINLIPVNSTAPTLTEKAIDLIADSPELIKKLKNSFSG